MLKVDSINVEKDISPDREGRRDNEAQVVLLWRFKTIDQNLLLPN